MGATKYITHSEVIEAVNHAALIIEYPLSDIEDKLTIFTSEAGLIRKAVYEMFVVHICFANPAPFFYHVSRQLGVEEKRSKIREQLLAAIYKHNPALIPSDLVINSNYVVKPRKASLREEIVSPLEENPDWNRPPDEPKPIRPSTVLPDNSIIEGNPFVEDVPEFNFPEEGFEDLDGGLNEDLPSPPTMEGVDAGGIVVGTPPYELVSHKWDRLGFYINVKRYEQNSETLLLLLGAAPFETVRGYQLLVVQLCIDDFSEVFHLLDVQGIPAKVSPENLVEELYEIALQYNPFLRLDDVNLKSIRQEYKKRFQATRRNHQSAQSGKAEPKAATALATKKKKLFKDVPTSKLLELSSLLKKRIVGQDMALEALSNALQVAAVGLKRPKEPIGVFLFAGKTGVGKSEAAKALADVLCEGALVRIDCSEYQQPHEVLKLTGSPPSYVGYEDGGVLTREVSATPFSVVLLDEIEKAHSNFHERILQVIDDGILTDNKGRKVSFGDVILIMTSNIGVDEVDKIKKTVGFGDGAQLSDLKTAKAREAALKSKFKPEFLNRLGEIIYFNSLSRDNELGILNLGLTELQNQLSKKYKVSLRFSDDAKNFLIDTCIEKEYGARALRRGIRRYVAVPLAQLLLTQESKEGFVIQVSLNEEKTGLSFVPVSNVAKKEILEVIG